MICCKFLFWEGEEEREEMQIYFFLFISTCIFSIL